MLVDYVIRSWSQPVLDDMENPFETITEECQELA